MDLDYEKESQKSKNLKGLPVKFLLFWLSPSLPFREGRAGEG
jgi:hypothetical protein